MQDVAPRRFGRKRKRGAPRVIRRQKGFARIGGYYGRYRPLMGRRAQSLGELKFHDVALNDVVVASTGAVTATINIIPQGVTEKQRVGRKCTIKAVHWKYTVTLPTTAGATVTNGDVLRMILYQDKQANGETAVNSDILEDATDNLSFYNLANESRFVILLDKTVSINPMAAAGDGAANDTPQVTKSLEFNKRCSIPLEFDAATGAITEIRSNNLGVLLISQNAVCGFTSNFRLRYADN